MLRSYNDGKRFVSDEGKAECQKLEADPDAVEKWRGLPQNKPSPKAFPPATGGLSLNRTLLVGFAVLVLIIVVLGLIFGR